MDKPAPCTIAIAVQRPCLGSGVYMRWKPGILVLKIFNILFMSKLYDVGSDRFVSLLCELDLLRWNPWIKLTFLSLQFQNWVINVWKLERRLRIPKKRSHLFSRRDPASSAILHFENLQGRRGREYGVMSLPQRIEILFPMNIWEKYLRHIWSDWSGY